MEVILTKNTDSLGKIGDIVNVSEGYARNFLLPQKRAVVANGVNLKMLEEQKSKVDAYRQQLKDEAETLAKKIAALSATYVREAGDEGKLFGSITAAEIMATLKDQGVTLEKGQILIHNPIRELGEFSVTIRLHPEVSTPFKVVVEKK